MVGELIAGRYELEKLVGSGGMSNVFRAHDRLLERTVALKILHEQFTRDDDYVERFRREARSVAQLAHPNIVTVIDRGEQDGRQYIVFEFVEGENLKDLVAHGALPVRDALGLERLHLFGSSWGGMLAMQYVLDHQPGLESLILCGSPASIPRWIEGCNELLAELPASEREILARHEASGFTACPEYQGALVTFYRRHVCRLDPWPEGLERSFLEIGADVYETMNGPSEFTVIGNFKDWDVLERLGEIRVPTLILSGRYDEARPDHMEEIHQRIAGSELTIFEDASHLCFYEQREAFMARMNEFLTATEG